MALDRVSKGEVFPHLITIPPPVTDSNQISALLEVGDDALHRALGDTHHLSDVAHPHLRLPYDAQYDVRMVGEKRPFRFRLSTRARGCALGCGRTKVDRPFALAISHGAALKNTRHASR